MFSQKPLEKGPIYVQTQGKYVVHHTLLQLRQFNISINFEFELYEQEQKTINSC